jgi:hypothetical protein
MSTQPERQPRVLYGMTLIAVGVLSLSLTPMARAGAIVTPPGLTPGDTYQLAFVTSSGIDATSSSIATYDNFVQMLASAAGLSTINGQAVTWHVIGSTATVAAIDHAPQLADIYNLAGQLVTRDAPDAGLWNTGNTPFANPININESGNVNDGLVWTGTNFLGEPFPSQALGQAVVFQGISGDVNSEWVELIPSPTPTNAEYVYALSSVITVTVPEPATLPLMGMSVAAWALIRVLRGACASMSGRARSWRGGASSPRARDGTPPHEEIAWLAQSEAHHGHPATADSQVR